MSSDPDADAVLASYDAPEHPEAANDLDAAAVLKSFDGPKPAEDNLSTRSPVVGFIRHTGTSLGANATAGVRSLWDLAHGVPLSEVDAKNKKFIGENTWNAPEGSVAGKTQQALESKWDPLTWPTRAAYGIGDKVNQTLGTTDVGPVVGGILDVGSQVLGPKGLKAAGAEREAVSIPRREPTIGSGEPTIGDIGDVSEAPGGHPLSAAAQAETQRIAALKGRAQQAGLDLPESGSGERAAAAAAGNTPKVASIARADMKLPQDAPLTPEMAQAARTKYASPAYQAIEKEPSINTPDISKKMTALSEKHGVEFDGGLYKAPAEDTMTGAEAVKYSQRLRDRARLYDRISNTNPTVDSQAKASLYRDAAESVEDAVQQHLKSQGKGQLATDWDNARVYVAKSHSYEDAMDGAGNIDPSKLKKQLFVKKKPLTGDQEMLAHMAAQYPEALKVTRASAPAPGLLRKGAAAVLPVGGAAVGGWMGGGLGAAAGGVVGKHLGEKILGD